MATLNQAQLIGYVGDEPKSIATRSGRTMVSFALATTDREVKRQDGTTIPERTEWHNITAFGRVGDFVRQYVHKGAMLFIQGPIRYRVYDKQDGSKGYVTEIVADNIQWLDRKNVAESSIGASETATAPAPQPATYDYTQQGINNDEMPF